MYYLRLGRALSEIWIPSMFTPFPVFKTAANHHGREWGWNMPFKRIMEMQCGLLESTQEVATDPVILATENSLQGNILSPYLVGDGCHEKYQTR